MDPDHDEERGVAIDALLADYDYFDPMMADDPFPVYRTMRKRCPILHTERYDGHWVATRYEDVTAINRDWERFSSAEGVLIPPVPMALPPLEVDPPLHAEYRRLLNPWFAPARCEELAPLLRQITNDYIDAFVDEGRAELVSQFANQMPGKFLFSHLLGVSLDDLDQCQEWVNIAGTQRGHDPEAAAVAQFDLAAFLWSYLEERQSGPARGDLVDTLLATEIAGEPLGLEGAHKIVNLLVFAGLETTASAISSSLWYLAEHPGDRRKLATHPELVPQAVEECLRYFSPIQALARVATEDVTVAGQTLRAGDKVLLCWASANRDGAEFPDPDEWRLDRDANRHVAFGVGFHRCLGSHLARVEMTAALEEFLRRIGDFAVDGTVAWHGGPTRGLSQLPVVF